MSQRRGAVRASVAARVLWHLPQLCCEAWAMPRACMVKKGGWRWGGGTWTIGGTAGILLAWTRPAAAHVGLFLSLSLSLSPFLSFFPLSMPHHPSFIQLSSCSLFFFNLSHYLSHCLVSSWSLHLRFAIFPLSLSFFCLSLSLDSAHPLSCHWAGSWSQGDPPKS